MSISLLSRKYCLFLTTIPCEHCCHLKPCQLCQAVGGLFYGSLATTVVLRSGETGRELLNIGVTALLETVTCLLCRCPKNS